MNSMSLMTRDLDISAQPNSSTIVAIGLDGTDGLELSENI